MNANQVINMVLRVVMRRVVGKGINAGINAVGNKMGKGRPAAEDDAQGPDTQDTAKRAKKSLKVARRVGRM